MEVLSGRIILRPADPDVTVRFYRDRLGLAIAREYPGGVVFFAGSALIEVAAHLGDEGSRASTSVLWLQIRDMSAATAELNRADVPITREARVEPWGLVEMHIVDPDGTQIIFVEIPEDHPIRRDNRADLPG